MVIAITRLNETVLLRIISISIARRILRAVGIVRLTLKCKTNVAEHSTIECDITSNVTRKRNTINTCARNIDSIIRSQCTSDIMITYKKKCNRSSTRKSTCSRIRDRISTIDSNVNVKSNSTSDNKITNSITITLTSNKSNGNRNSSRDFII